MVAVSVLPATAQTTTPGSETSMIEAARSAWSSAHPEGDFDYQVEYQRDFRSQFDFLDESDSAIAAVMGASVSNDSFARWGLQMTNAESSEMDRRDRIQREFPDIAGAAVGDDWSEELVEGLDPTGTFGAFAGRWIDQQDGGRLVVALVPTHSDYAAAKRRAEAQVSALVSDDRLDSDDVRFVDAQFTADDLYRVNKEFSEQYLTEGVHDRTMIGLSASMNPVENRVDLYVEPGWVSAAQTFAAKYTEGLVEIVEVPDGFLSVTDTVDPEDDWGAGNWHSGAKFDVYDGDLDWQGACSWGATARTTSYVYAVTAAHCLGYSSNSLGTTGFWNDWVSNNTARGFRTWGGDDWIVGPNDHAYVYVYHGVRGDLARMNISVPGNVNDYECYLENFAICGQRITRRELTTETEIGDTKCVALASRGYVCATLNSNDAPISGYDYLRGIDTNSGNHSQDGDSGAGVHESTLMTGIVKGHTGWWGYDTYFTHAYYIETSGYLAASKVCGTSGICDN